MKIFLILIIVSATACTAVAQNPFSQKDLQEILDQYKKDSKQFFSERLSTGFRAITRQGLFEKKEEIVNRDAQRIVSTEILQPMIIQSANLAVVSGIHRTTRTGTGGSNETTEVACTYTFERRNGKWMFVASQQTPIIKK